MKYIKLFEEFKSKEEILDILINEYHLNKSYITINDNNIVDYSKSIDISNIGLKEIKVQFGTVNGYFDCSRNSLTSLKGAPSKINGGFYCNNNNLTSLEYSPIEGIKHLHSDHNYLSNLKGITKNSLYTLNIQDNPLYSFEYFPYFTIGFLFLTDNLEYIYDLFYNEYNLIDTFNDYNIIKAPKNTGDKPRLKVSNLNKFLSDNGFKELKDTSELEKYYELK